MVEVGNAFEMSSMHGKWRRAKRERGADACLSCMMYACLAFVEIHTLCDFVQAICLGCVR